MRKLTDRRAFLSKALGASAAVLSGCGRGWAAVPTTPSAATNAVKSQPDVIVYRGGYPGWPWVAKAGAGKLVCVWRDDSVHGFSASGKVMWSESRDNGKTWAAGRIVVDEPGVDDRNAAVVQLPDGAWMVCYNTYTSKAVSRSNVVVSKDRGAHWTRPVTIADLDARTRAAPLALSSGDLLIPFYKAPGNGALAARSSDGGKTWDVAGVPDVKGFVGDEWTALEVEPGRLIGIIRNSGVPRDGYFWKTESRDGGRRWSRPVKTNVQSARHPSPAHLDLHGKTPVLTYADRRMVSVSMVTTRDHEFARWDVEKRLPCYQYRPDGKPIRDGSYPVSVAVGRHRRFIVDYEIRPEGKQIAGYFVDLPHSWL